MGLRKDVGKDYPTRGGITHCPLVFLLSNSRSGRKGEGGGLGGGELLLNSNDKAIICVVYKICNSSRVCVNGALQPPETPFFNGDFKNPP